MENLFLIIFLLSGLCLIIGLIKPGIVIRWGNEDKRNRKKVLITYGIAIVVSFILFGVFCDSVENDGLSENVGVATDGIKDEGDKLAEQNNNNQLETGEVNNDEDKNIEEVEIIDETPFYNTIDYKQLARFPESYEGNRITFNGEVIQTLEDNNTIEIRLAIDESYDNIVYCWLSKDIATGIGRILEGDYITVNGISRGILTYEAVMGQSISIPSMELESLELHEDVFNPNATIKADDFEE